MSWTGLILAVVGGDDREAEIPRLAAETGATVRGDGFPATEAVQTLMAASAEDAQRHARWRHPRARPDRRDLRASAGCLHAGASGSRG